MFFFSAKPLRLDIGLVFGSSDSSGATFEAEKDLAVRIIEKYNISKDATLVGAILYGKDASVAWYIGDALDGINTKYRIKRLSSISSGNNVLHALLLARDQLFSENEGGRNGFPKTLIVFLDGKEKVESKLLEISDELKRMGVKVIVIEMRPTDRQPPLGIASDAKSIISVKNVSEGLDDVASKVSEFLAPGKIDMF